MFFNTSNLSTLLLLGILAINTSASAMESNTVVSFHDQDLGEQYTIFAQKLLPSIASLKNYNSFSDQEKKEAVGHMLAAINSLRARNNRFLNVAEATQAAVTIAGQVYQEIQTVITNGPVKNELEMAYKNLTGLTENGNCSQQMSDFIEQYGKELGLKEQEILQALLQDILDKQDVSDKTIKKLLMYVLNQHHQEFAELSACDKEYYSTLDLIECAHEMVGKQTPQLKRALIAFTNSDQDRDQSYYTNLLVASFAFAWAFSLAPDALFVFAAVHYQMHLGLTASVGVAIPLFLATLFVMSKSLYNYREYRGWKQYKPFELC